MKFSRLQKFILLFISIQYNTFIYCQNEYYKIDTVITKGNDFVFNLDFQFCQVKTGKFYDNYTPYQVSEFGYKDRVFVAKKVQLPDSVQQVFLERLVVGKNNLYYHGGKKYKTFFVSNDSMNLVEIPFRNTKGDSTFRMQLNGFVAECSQMKDVPKLVQYKRTEMKEFFSQVNDCKSKYFPFLKYGIATGVQFVRLDLTPNIATNELSKMNYQYTAGLAVGAFADIPILPTSFSIYTSANLSKHGFSDFKQISEDDVDFILNLTTLKLPVMLKYTLPVKDYRLYIGGGLSFSYHIINKAELYKITKTDNLTDFSLYQELAVIDDFQYGFLAETGVEKKISYRNYLSLGMRYSKMLNRFLSFGSSELSVVMSLNI